MLVNEQAIIDAELQTHPWEHIVVDNFIEEETFSTLLRIADYFKKNNHRISELEWYDPDDNEAVFGLSRLRRFGVQEYQVKAYAKVLEDIHKLKETIWSKFSYHRASSEHTTLCNGALNWTGVGGKFHIHNDSIYKSISIIIYFDPEEHDQTTTLWKERNLESEFVRPKWKRNRAVIFCPNEKTWHSVEPIEKERMVLACFVEFLPKYKEEHLERELQIEKLNFSCGYSTLQWKIEPIRAK